MITFTIKGAAISSKNSKIQSVKNGRAFSFKNPDYAAFEELFVLQVPREARRELDCRVAVSITAYYPDDRCDMDLEGVYDLLQLPRRVRNHMTKGAGVIRNDRQIVEKHAYKFIDPDNPRLEIRIQPLPNWERSGKQKRLPGAR